MALMYTPKSSTQTKFPSFKLKTVFGKEFSSSQVAQDKVKVLMFICNHCPYVQAVEDRLLKLASSMAAKPVEFIGVCSNDWADHPEDSPENLAARVREKSYPFVYLVDEDQSLAKEVGAVCTPDIFVFAKDGSLFYRGRIDDSWKNASLVKRQELRDAIECAISGTPLDWEEIPSMGCSIKWKKD